VIELATTIDVRQSLPYLMSLANGSRGVSMALELTVTAKGQVTLRREVLDHLGVMAGTKVSVSLLENGRIELVAAAARGDVRGLRGALRRPGQRPVSLEEMQEAIEAGHGR
jgi:hypothetical protein